MNTNRLDKIRIVLVEPAGPLNVGSIARVMKNMGLQHLVIVNPQCDPLSEPARIMAVHGVDILESAQQVNSLPEALIGCQRAIATTARTRHLSTPLESPKTILPKLLQENLPSALIFGPEDRGLSNTELNYAQWFLRIPSNPNYPSLNLAQSVAVCAYELYHTASAPIKPSEETEIQNIATLDMLEGYYQHLERVLLQMGYLYPHTTTARMEKFRQVYNRASLTPEELALLRGILGHTEWLLQHLPPISSLKSNKKPSDSEQP
ncbi:RNA methyltransferase [Aphanothece hegewaldii CCALA 016]|uniref:tRNA (cytidine/uridine-2'-O-)-methyltransferase TrmJ n=1 Tax=Aphanothece hegewaldii CCALA 016 TaxID=2107694 RepID=A0A2T1LSP0_9CHRO|nr:RNA methyltransferase [Aphanothece hegewaldii]PSF33067.1 RNA methyltransferase [Aphanothece hegewaldii CCALA 016]